MHLSARIGYSTGELARPDDGSIVFLSNPIDFRTDLVRLSRLAVTTCQNQNEFQYYSGAWYSPETSGEGFVVEVLPDDRAIVYWFAYEPGDSGKQAWMIGVGTIEWDPPLSVIPEPISRPTISLETIYQPVDTGQSFPADLTGLEPLDWGEVAVSFDGTDTGFVAFVSNLLIHS